jgi:hypothetical protein
MPVYPQRVTWRDWRGDIARTAYYLSAANPATAQTHGASWFGSLSTKSRAALQSASGAFNSQPQGPVYGVNTQRYTTVEDRAVLFWRLGAGALYRMEIPAPNDQFFLADQETVDITNAAVVNLQTVGLLAALCTREGELLGNIIGGNRARRKTTKTLTLARRFS